MVCFSPATHFYSLTLLVICDTCFQSLCISLSFSAMFQDPTFNSQRSQASGPRERTTPFPGLVGFPTELDYPADSERATPDRLDSLSFDGDKGFTGDHRARYGSLFALVSRCSYLDSSCGSVTFRPKSSANLLSRNVQRLPYRSELYSGLSSPAWSTTKSGVSSPAYTLPRTPGTSSYPTPVLGTRHLHPHPTPPCIPSQHFGGESSTFSPTYSPWTLPATIASSPVTSVTDAHTRYVTRDIHATRYERPPPSQPRFLPSFSVPTTGSAYGSHETGLQLTIQHPKPLRADASIPQLLSYGLTVPADAHAYSFMPYDANGRLNITSDSAEDEEAKDDVQYMPCSTKPAKKTFGCSHCSRAFARTQDLTRHMKTVHGEGKQWVCCGVPMGEAYRYRISADAVKIGPMEHDGVLMIGGCGREFGRKDTYAKHLKSVRTRCVGDTDALYHS